MVCSLERVRTIRSSVAVGLPVVLGRFTSMPRYMSGAVSMKISSSTRVTSTSGMMLISARAPPTLMAIFCHSRHLLHRARERVEQIEGEALHLHRPVLGAVDEEVVAHHRGDRGPGARRGGDQGLRDARRHHREVGRALLADALEGGHDAPHRAEA